jgi:hypothetical protein
MNQSRLTWLKALLYLGCVYYLIGAVAHFFGLTIFPFYDSHLYVPYHDTVIALVAIVLAIILFIVARNPVKNIEVLDGLLIGGIIAIVFSIIILKRIDFVQLGAPAKRFQTIIEMILLVIYISAVYILRPNAKSLKK